MLNEVGQYEAPPYILSPEEERMRREHQRRMEEERQRLKKEAEKRRRYKLQREAEAKRIREIKRKKELVVKIVIGGIVVTILASSLAGIFKGNESKAATTTNPYEIHVVDGNQDSVDDNAYSSVATTQAMSEDVEVISIDLSYEARRASIDTSGKFAVGSEVNAYFFSVLNNNNNTYNLFLKYGEMYGVDPYILMAKAFQESSFNHNACLPGGKNYNGYGVGIMQHEKPDGRTIVAHNYITGEDDVMYVTMANAANIEYNIKMGAMHFQNCLERNNGNLLLALQEYNYGQGMINSILKSYAGAKGITVDAVKSSYDDTGWLSLVEDAHNNAWRYIDGWSGSYGDADYIEHVLRYFIGSDTYYYYNGEKIVFDLNTFEMIKVDENVKVIS